MKLTMLIPFLIVVYAAGANAAPTYLSCTTSSNEKKITSLEITADESNQQVSYSIVETGFTQKLPGIFTADKVRFVSSPGQMTEMQFEIDRTTLAITRSLPRMKAVIGTDKAESGSCTVVEAPKARKF